MERGWTNTGLAVNGAEIFIWPLTKEATLPEHVNNKIFNIHLLS